MPVNDCENNCTLKTRVDRLEKDFEAEKGNQLPTPCGILLSHWQL